MKQPVKKKVGTTASKKKTTKVKKTVIHKAHLKNATRKFTKGHPEYGVSKLEKDFARDFLDKLRLPYIYQYKAEDIGRYFDFAIGIDRDRKYLMEEKEGIKSISQNDKFFKLNLMVEVDGDFHHSHPDKYKEEDLTPMQKHNRFVDKLKNEWCAMHCVPLLRIWEHDIRHNPEKVMSELSKYIDIGDRKKKILETKRRGH